MAQWINECQMPIQRWRQCPIHLAPTIRPSSNSDNTALSCARCPVFNLTHKITPDTGVGIPLPYHESSFHDQFTYCYPMNFGMSV
ncbi:hypothetical protein GDO78_003988 [Eleutherodactylus coqui]|uniref:Uncharacterized protein n=1 Tax=Eleutherodactylus coqui TaxID=57060 RepID=A0A8J6K1C2_ELECQ|nr:hypothetical protein GDO78_003988 [Eleutherodactylus coqui]